MVEFLSLFLGLVLGPFDVKLEVSASVDGRPVASVELLLDERSVAMLRESPWTAEVDFGDRLRPRRLTAVARDAQGLEIGRAVQKVNYLRPAYEAVIVLEAPSKADRGRSTRKGRLISRAVLDQEPISRTLSFDGRPVAVGVDGSFELPPYDPAAPHALEAEATFPDGGKARAEMAFGGGLGERMNSSLTAVVLRSPLGKPFDGEDLDGAFRHRGQKLDVFGARAPAGLLVTLHDRGAGKHMRRLDPGGRTAGANEKWLRELRDFDVLAMSSREMEQHPGVFPYRDLGAVSQHLGARGVLVARPDKERRPQKLWAALAAAGKQAAAYGRPRAVALMLGSDPEKYAAPSGISAVAAADYLETIRVPLFIWAPKQRVLEKMGLADRPRVFSGRNGFGFMADNLERELSSQTVVWLEGDFFPHELELTGEGPRDLDWAR